MLTPDQHLVVEMLADPVGCTRSLRRMHDAALRGKRPAGRVRSVVASSWQRSMSANVDPDAVTAPIAYSNSDVLALRENHPLSTAIATARQTLLDIADAAQHVVIVTDAHGVILWCDGASAIRAAAEDVGLIEGAIITEDAIGTNAVGTALATDRPTLIHSAEHLVRTFHTWTCSASPLHDPDTGEVLGVIDISSGVASAHPSSSVLVSTTAQLVEHQMRIAVTQRDAALRAANQKHLADLRGAGGALLSPTGRVLASEGTDPLPERIPITTGRVPLGDGREGIIEPLAEGYLLRLARQPQLAPDTALSLTVLGAAQPAVTLNGHRILLTDRHAEILTLLALRPSGLTSEQLTFHLYGDTGTVATTRAEIHRLRAQLGSTLATRPYRLRASVTADLLSVKTALRAGDAHRALAAYRGALLPRSEAPTIRAERDELHSAVRRAAIDHGGGDELFLLAETDIGREDLELLDAAHRALPPHDPRRAMVASRANRVLTED